MKNENITTPEETQLQLLELAKEDNQNIKSIKNNIKFIAWYLIISIIAALFVLIPILSKTGFFKAY